MVSHMKTTLNINEEVMRKLKQEAARTGKTMSELVEAALRDSFEKRRSPPIEVNLPTFKGGRAMVDVANRDRLYDIMEGR